MTYFRIFSTFLRGLGFSFLGVVLSASIGLANPSLTPAQQAIVQTLSPSQKNELKSAYQAKSPDALSTSAEAARVQPEVLPVPSTNTNGTDGTSLFFSPDSSPFLSGKDLYTPDSLGSDVRPEATPSRTLSVKLFGYDFFRNSTDQFISDSLPVGPDYVIGPGDSITVHIWGKIEESIELTVNDQGDVYLPKVGRTSINGVLFKNINSVIKSALSKEYVNFELNVTVTNLRRIRVYVLGDVIRPGAYDVSSLSTVFHALIKAGGPSQTGSLRTIQLKRGNTVIQTIDLYDYLLNGDKKMDVPLENFDTIFIPVIGNVVQVTGLVKRAGIFELKGKTSLNTVIRDYAGGFTPRTYMKRVQITRIDGGEFKVVQDLIEPKLSNFNATLASTMVSNGDVIQIYPILNTAFNYVSVEGPIAYPGQYGLEKSTTLGAIITQAGGMNLNEMEPIVDIIRYISTDKRMNISVDTRDAALLKTPLQEWDIIQIYPKRFSESVSIEGAVRNPGSYRRLDGMKLFDLLRRSEPLEDADLSVVEVYRNNVATQSDLVFRVNAVDYLKNEAESSSNIRLQSRDRISVKIDQPSVAIRSIVLEGEVRYPGVYSAVPGERISDVILRAGGFTDTAFPGGMIYTRVNVLAKQKVGYNRSVEEEQKRLIYDQSRYVTFDDQDHTDSYQNALKFLQFKEKEASGRIIIEYSNWTSFIGSQYDLVVEDGDRLSIPHRPSSVPIIGGVNQPSAVTFVSGKPATFYIDRVGGRSEFAKKNEVLIFRANGSVAKSGNVELGDVVYVPEEIKIRTNWVRLMTNVTQILTNFVLALAVVGTFK